MFRTEWETLWSQVEVAECSRQRCCSNMLYLCLHWVFIHASWTQWLRGCDLNMSQSKRNCTCWQPKHPKSLLPRRYFHMIPRLPRVAPHFSAWINSGNMMQNKQATLTQFGACAGRLHILARLAPQAKPKWVASGIGLISLSSVLGLISPDPCLFASGLIWVRSWHFSKQSATRTDHGPLMSTISLYGCQYMSILSQYWVNTL